MANGHQKADHGGNFFMTPRRVVGSVAWRELSCRACKILWIFQAQHDGFNNGKIGLGIHQIGKAIGNQNHRANARAVAELIEHGFIECMSNADRHHAKVREYRVTFIPSGGPKATRAATHEYRHWRPRAGQKRKFGGAKITTESDHSVVVSAMHQKFSGAVSATPLMENDRISVAGCVAETAPLIGY